MKLPLMTPDAAAEVVVDVVAVVLVPVPTEVDDVAPEVVDAPELVLVEDVETELVLVETVEDVREVTPDDVVTPEAAEVEVVADEPVIEVVELVPMVGMEDETVEGVVL